MFSSKHQEEIKSMMISVAEPVVAASHPAAASNILLSLAATDLEPEIHHSADVFVMPSESPFHIKESTLLIVSPAATSYQLINFSARQYLHENHLSEIKDQILADSPSSNNQTAMEIEIDNVKQTGKSIKDLFKNFV